MNSDMSFMFIMLHARKGGAGYALMYIESFNVSRI